ncbi:MAG: 50S ribosomal protein L18e [Candidatus Nanoarchaeia archaeon]
MRTGPTNPNLQKLIINLKSQKAKIWKRVARELERPTRERREVNLSRLEHFANEKDIVLVPGKVLGGGILTKSLQVAALTFSKTAKDKILNAKGKVMSITELMEKNPKGTGIKLLG